MVDLFLYTTASVSNQRCHYLLVEKEDIVEENEHFTHLSAEDVNRSKGIRVEAVSKGGCRGGEEVFTQRQNTGEYIIECLRRYRSDTEKLCYRHGSLVSYS